MRKYNIVHCHPSGNPELSNEDVVIAKKLVEVGRLLDIAVLDYIIFAEELYISFAEKRLL
jgi:DNA repair protein RadC